MLTFRGTAALVTNLLTNDPQTRNSDNLLYLRVLEHHAQERNIDLSNIPLPTFLSNAGDWGFPCFESVRRSRQKAQEKFPELAACKTITESRMVNEEKYRAFALTKL